MARCVPDTGAQVSVTTEDMVNGFPLLANLASKEGRGFTSASKHTIPCVGEYDLPTQSPEGVWTRQRWQVAPEGTVARPLLSIGEECDSERFVLFGKNGGAIIDQQSGAVRKFPRLANGAYEIEMWIPPADLVETVKPGFTRRGS